jgi:RHS repeat-associated protein
MVLTQEKDTAKYIATMEAAYRSTENQLFYNIPQSSYARSVVAGYPTDNTTVPNDPLARVNGSGQKVGPSILLRVMSGDVVDIATKSFYKSGGTVQSPNSTLTDVLNSLASGIVTATSASHGVVTALTNPVSSPVYSALNSFLPSNDPNTVGKPKAYLNWILLDDQFKGVNPYPQSGAIPVGSADVLNTLAYSGIPITKNGYLYIWVSNETPGWDVFFDNLSVQQRSGPITEETHYYPFGLTMAGISSQAAGGLENKIKFQKQELQHKEFSDGSGLEMYEFKYRMDDPQTGRFWQIDPLSDKYVYNSTYAFSENKVTGHVELEGLESININNLLHVNREKHPGSKDLNTIQLNLSNVIKSSYIGYDQKTSAKSDFISAFQTILGKTTTINDLTQIKSISETKISTNSKIIDEKFLEMSTSSTTTEVKLNVDEITSVSKTTSTTTSTMAIESIDSKDNSITVATSPISTVNSPIISSQIEPGKNLSNLSSGLRDQTNDAIKNNNQAFSKYEDVLKGAIKSVQN